MNILNYRIVSSTQKPCITAGVCTSLLYRNGGTSIAISLTPNGFGFFLSFVLFLYYLLFIELIEHCNNDCVMFVRYVSFDLKINNKKTFWTELKVSFVWSRDYFKNRKSISLIFPSYFNVYGHESVPRLEFKAKTAKVIFLIWQ